MMIKLQSDKAFEQLRDLIVQVKLPPGSLLDEAELTNRLGVGRTPYREALQRLERDSLVNIIPRRGAFVSDASPKQLEDRFEVRSILDSGSARLAAMRAQPKDIETLEAFIESLDACPDDMGRLDRLAVDHDFHFLVAQATGNGVLAATISRLHTMVFRHVFLLDAELPPVAQEATRYVAVVEAIKRGDQDAAEEAMLVHMRNAFFSSADRTIMIRSRGG